MIGAEPRVLSAGAGVAAQVEVLRGAVHKKVSHAVRVAKPIRARSQPLWKAEQLEPTKCDGSLLAQRNDSRIVREMKARQERWAIPILHHTRLHMANTCMCVPTSVRISRFCNRGVVKRRNAQEWLPLRWLRNNLQDPTDVFRFHELTMLRVAPLHYTSVTKPGNPD